MAAAFIPADAFAHAQPTPPLDLHIDDDCVLQAGPFAGETFRGCLRGHPEYAMSLFNQPVSRCIQLLPFIVYCVHKLSV